MSGYTGVVSSTEANGTLVVDPIRQKLTVPAG